MINIIKNKSPNLTETKPAPPSESGTTKYIIRTIKLEIIQKSETLIILLQYDKIISLSNPSLIIPIVFILL